MLDYNHHPRFHERVNAVIDEALARERTAQTARSYLGASRLGVACERALQYEYAQPRMLLPLSRSWFKGTLLEAHWPY
ncbi:hypothetical protein [Pandoraea sp. CB10b_02]|uniref:hypothetical protein n=1 Tax=Pandoraea sp. CB10b_02 TaxID=2014535 RepID=UPI0025795C29|nr:hypothetical protein [Pandoraea sp. CB10b_02]